MLIRQLPASQVPPSRFHHRSSFKLHNISQIAPVLDFLIRSDLSNMCDVDHGFCSTCCKSGYKLRKLCRAGKKAKENCNPSFCVAHKAIEKNWVCARCAHAKQRREAKEILEKEQRMERMEKMEKVRKAMETRAEKMEKVGKVTAARKGMEEVETAIETRKGVDEVGTAIETRKAPRGVRKGMAIKKAMEIKRLVNEEGQNLRGDSDHHGGGGELVND